MRPIFDSRIGTFDLAGCAASQRIDEAMKRFWINAAQMSAAVTIGFLLSPIVLSTQNMLHHFFGH